MKAVVAAFNQEKALVGAFSVITNLRMDLFEALACELPVALDGGHAPAVGDVDAVYTEIGQHGALALRRELVLPTVLRNAYKF